MNFKLLTLAAGAVLLSSCSSTPAQNPPLQEIAPAPAEAQAEAQPSALDLYLKAPQNAYEWKKAPGDQTQGDGDANLNLVSQTWQGKNWTHRVQIFQPQNPQFADAAILNINFGSGSPAESLLGRSLADATGATVVNLFNVPNQPLFNRTEDELIAYTLQKALETGDPSWPLLFPMTRSVISAMDAVGEWSDGKIKRFIISGASKRGWTTYFAGASGDKRVVGLVPIVYDNLNLTAQIGHQKQIWKSFSNLSTPYQKIGLFDMAGTPTGEKLAAMVDPFALKERLTMPKLLVNATNDGFWPHDASNLYLKELPGENRLMFVPNAPHSLGASVFSVAGSAAAWSRLVLSGKTAPSVVLQSEKNGDTWDFSAKIEGAAPQVVRLWLANSSSQDFRQAKWRAIELLPRDGGYSTNLDARELFGNSRNVAAFAEIEVASVPLPLKISSPMWQSERE